MSEKRVFPILNGKLLSDLDLNGCHLIGTDSIIEIVTPSADGEGKAADAKKTYEAIAAEERRAKLAEENLKQEVDKTLKNLQLKCTYEVLKILRDNGSLVPGMQYRITDYVATTVQQYTKAVSHPFDIIVTAENENTLSEIAQAIRHEGDTYFQHCKLESWKIWYSLDNDASRFLWADDKNGKGVVYRLIDEWNNDVPYDFKGIMVRKGSSMSEVVYTFGNSNDANIDETVKENSSCYGNVIGEYRWNGLKIPTNNFVEGCRDNNIGVNCYGNTFGVNCSRNVLLAECYNNSFSNYCGGIYIGELGNYNTFGVSCSGISLGYYCYNNKFSGYNFSCSFGDQCVNNEVADHCQYLAFGNNCRDNMVYKYFKNITFRDGASKIYLNCSKERGDSACCQNIEIKSGFTKSTFITVDDVNQSYNTEYKPKDSKTISM